VIVVVIYFTAKEVEIYSPFFLHEVLKPVFTLSSQVPPDPQSLDVNPEPTAPVPTVASVDNCPPYLSRKILLLLFLNFRAEDPLEFVDIELRDRTDQVCG
jgi:hypothetical protein